MCSDDIHPNDYQLNYVLWPLPIENYTKLAMDAFSPTFYQTNNTT